MLAPKSFFVSLALIGSTATASPSLSRRDVTWGPIVGFQATTSEIISTVSTIYPGKMPSGQKGYMFAWVGITAEGGDLIQSIVGSYPAGLSECTGPAADTTWCISSEVHGLDSTGATVQFVGDKTTADTNYENGIIFNYTLIDKSTYLWEQTMTDAVTGELLSSYRKTSGKMTLWNTAVELQDNYGAAPRGTIEPQYYTDTTIVLAEQDAAYKDGLFTQNGATISGLATGDGGKTWTIEKITVPAMTSS